MFRGDRARQPNMALAATVSPGGKRLFIAHTMVDTGDTRVASVAVGGYGLAPQGDVPIVSTVSTFDLETNRLMRPHVKASHNSAVGTDVMRRHRETQLLSQPVALLHDPRTPELLLASMGSDRVMGLDTRSSDPMSHPQRVYLSGQAPKGMALTQDGRTLLVHNSQEFSVSIYARHPSPPVGPTRWARKAVSQFEISRDPLPQKARRGRRLFTFALDSRIGGRSRFACASCHPDGRHDGMVWQIGAGPRRTPILATRVQGTGPFNWLGTEDKLESNVLKTVHRLGGAGITQEEAASLSTYISLYMDGLDNPNQGRNSALVSEGRRLFHSGAVGCSGCHDSSTEFTDGSMHDVGSTSAVEVAIWKRFQGNRQLGLRPGGPPQQLLLQIEPFGPPARNRRRAIPVKPLIALKEPPIAYNTPSLRHVWAHSRYFHDGSRRSLHDLLTRGNKRNQMGNTAHLDSHQIDALEAYLKSL
jgi:cytochrome c peroxidase